MNRFHSAMWGATKFSLVSVEVEPLKKCKYSSLYVSNTDIFLSHDIILEVTILKAICNRKMK